MSQSKIVNVLVTGVGGGGNGEQIIKSLRYSKTFRYHIIGTDITSFSKGLYEVDVAKIVPPVTNPNYLNEILNICKEEKVSICIPGSEIELKLISDNRHLFDKQQIFLPINDRRIIDLCLDKYKTNLFLQKSGFSVPTTLIVKPNDDIKGIDFFPVVIKPLNISSGSKDVFIVQTKEELLKTLDDVFKKNSKMVIQQYVGSYKDEYTVGILMSLKEYRLINSIAVKREILYGFGNKLKVENKTKYKDLGDYLVISSGISQGRIGKYIDVCKPCEDISFTIKSKGPLNIQCRKVKDKIFVFEINPRFSGTTFFRTLAGFNEVDIIIREFLLNEHFFTGDVYNSGYVLRGLSEIFVTSLQDSKKKSSDF